MRTEQASADQGENGRSPTALVAHVLALLHRTGSAALVIEHLNDPVGSSYVHRLDRYSRRRLARQSYVLRKSRTRNTLAVGYGTYRIVATRANTVEAGEPHGLSLQEVLLSWIDG